MKHCRHTKREVPESVKHCRHTKREVLESVKHCTRVCGLAETTATESPWWQPSHRPHRSIEPLLWVHYTYFPLRIRRKVFLKKTLILSVLFFGREDLKFEHAKVCLLLLYVISYLNRLLSKLDVCGSFKLLYLSCHP